MKMKMQGEIVCDAWAESYRRAGYQHGFFCPGDLRDALDRLPSGEDLTLEVNSVGGDVDAAAEMYSVIRNAVSDGRRIVAEVQSLAASAASWLILACNEVRISLSAQLMIHCAWGVALGNARAMSHAAEDLGMTDETILNLYCVKCGGKASRETLQQLMDHETYITAPEAVRMGLADSIIGGHDPADFPAVANGVQSCIVRAMRVLPPIEDLTAPRSEQARRRRAAWLEIEAERYR